ncbi:hypothetical protein [Flavobacterium sp.]|uniref:hypothetical protein n=1 Tax=Flavobacterium sp. TaxID=239 RepID=UPI00286E06F6|nr:hypothetical protein [Flavobacterium sp.]
MNNFLGILHSIFRYILKSLFTKIFCFVFAVFVLIDFVNLKNYTIYNGKVTDVENVTTTHSSYRKSVKINRDIPKFEYYRKKDTVKTEEGSLVMYSNFNVNDELQILESKEDQYQIKIFNVFYYWIGFNKLIIITFLALFIFGFYKVFIKKAD